MLNANDKILLTRLVQDVQSSREYRDISPALISNIAALEIGKRRTYKEVLKATKNKLHQVGGAYHRASTADYDAWMIMLEQAIQTGSREKIELACRTIMSHHASTRERLSILDQFYNTILASLPPIRSVLDIACGLNPLALPWMPLQKNATYYAYDIYQQMTDFLQRCFSLFAIDGHAQVCDVIQSCPQQEADVAFLLKTLPCIEQIDKQAGKRLLQTLNARYVVVSFPVHSLGGRNKGMASNYETRFIELINDLPYLHQRFEFATELVFLLERSEQPPSR